MSTKSFAVAAALVAAASTAYANDVTGSPPFTGLTATFSALHTAGAFTDTFTFTLPGITSADVSVVTIGSGVADIDFASGTLNGLPLTLFPSNILRPQQIETELSHDVLNPAHVPL